VFCDGSFVVAKPTVGLFYSSDKSFKRGGKQTKDAADDEPEPEYSKAINGSFKSNGSSTTTTTTTGNRRRRRQKVDFPPFAYDIAMKRQTEREPYVMKFKNSTGKEEVVRACTHKRVSVPKPEPKQSLLSRLEMAWMGTPLEASLNMISSSASQTRLRNERSYARKEPFKYENIGVAPSLSDLSTPPISDAEGFWISIPARFLSFISAYFAFPYIIRFLDTFVTMPPEQLDEITQKFTPGISILYGTYISLTLSVLYNRQRTIQDNVGIECSYLVVITRNLITLFRNHRERTIEAGQCVADQIRTLVRSSRGSELMLLMYSDPYARMKELVDVHEEELFQGRMYDGRSGSLIANCRDTIKDLYKVRANRLSDEALALPPTHFLILNFLTLLILLGYTVSIVPTLDLYGNTSRESCLLFAVLCTIYILFYNFASDLNGPFQGVYQVRRSCAASHLLQLKWLLANHPLLRGEVDFEDPEEEADGVQIQSPGLGELWFEKEEIFVDDSGDMDDTGSNRKDRKFRDPDDY
jgi:hypothetical protein